MVFYFSGYTEYSEKEVEGNVNLNSLDVVKYLMQNMCLM